MKRKLLFCSSMVNRDAVSRTTIDGVEHIIVSSFTLPANIVMNGIMYPAAEIDASFSGLNRTLAPIEHPTNSNGQFISANDPDALHNFHAGAFNDNASKVGDRVKIDKIINVQEALKTDRGRRLLDRINEIETSKNPRPIHTSTGIFLEIEDLAEPQTNSNGDKFQMIARNMVFDHDAILLDSIGAAEPSQGVGMAVNSAGENIDVLSINIDGQSTDDLRREVMDALERSAISGVHFIEELFDDHVIFQTESGLFTVPFSLEQSGRATITGIPLPVERQVSFIPKINSTKVNEMKAKIVAVLNDLGHDTEGMDDDALLTAYNEALTKKLDAVDDPTPTVNNATDGQASTDDDIGDSIKLAIANAIKPVQDQANALSAQMAMNSDAGKADTIKVIVASSKYPDLAEDDLNAISLEKLKTMAGNCGHGYGLSLNFNGNTGDANGAPAEMPE